MSRNSFLIVVSLILGLVSCKKNTDSIDNRTIHIRLTKDPDRIHPLIFPNPLAREVYQYIHIPPADYDPESLELTPILIKEMPEKQYIDTGFYAGGVAVDFEFRDDAVWENGSPIKASDYLFTMKAINLSLTNAGRYRDVVNHITAIKEYPDNDRKITVIFKEDYMLAVEASVNIEIYPEYVYDGTGILSDYAFEYFVPENENDIKSDSLLLKFSTDFNSEIFSRNIISGAGPYKFVSWEANRVIVLEKKQNFRRKESSNPFLKQGPERIVFHIIPDEVTAIAQLKAGNIDVINGLSSDSYESLESDKVYSNKFSFFHPLLTREYYFLLNHRDDILKELSVRKALAHLIDIDNFITTLEKGKANRTIGPINPIKRTYDKDIPFTLFDPIEAKKILENDGWSDTDNDGIFDKVFNGIKRDLELEILISGQELGRKMAVLSQQSAAKTGIKIKITEKDFKLIKAENINTGKFQIVPSIISQDLQTWDDLSRWHSDGIKPGGNNESAYYNPLVDGWIDSIRTERNDSEKMRMYKLIQKTMDEDQAAIFLYAPQERIVISKKWQASATSKRPGYLANTFSLKDTLVDKK